MKPAKNPSDPGQEARAETQGGPPLWTEALRSLLAEFPDAALATDRANRVVFLNRAAQKLLGDTLKVGDSCWLCSRFSGWHPAGPDVEGRCLKKGERPDQLPLMLEVPSGALVPLTVTVTPIGGDGAARAGCLVVLRGLQADLSAHPAMQQQSATLSSILENFPMPFFMVSPDLKLTHINARMERLTGYSREEAVGRMTCGQVLNTVQCGTCECVLKQVMETQKAVSGVRRVVRDRQGREIPVTVSASIITDPAGNIIGGFEAIRDITPIVEAEKKIELLTELTREGILMADEDQRIVFANSRIVEILGRTREELMGRDLGEVLSPQHLQMAAGMMYQAGGETQGAQFCSTLDHPFADQAGEGRVFETCMAISRIGQKKLSCIYLRDLTNRVRIERELHKTNTFLYNIIRCSVDGIVVVDTDGVPLIFNEGAERILGYKAEEVIGHPEVFKHFYPPHVAMEMMRRMRSDDYGPRDKLNTTQVSFFGKNGEEVPVSFSASIIRERGREVASVGIFSDLREHLKMRKELEESQTQLMQSEKIASLGRLAAGVAHEINNPLAGILIYAELLLREIEKDSENYKHVEVIISQIHRCQQIVTRLLEFTRQSLAQKTLFSPNDIIGRSVELISHQAIFHDIKIIQNLDPGVPQILGNPGQLQQVFTNLLLNAADALGGRGQITITSRPAARGEGVVLTFADTGKGIPSDIRDKIFEPFFTTKPPGKGTGLGLSIVYGVIKRHGGRIYVDNVPGGGASFTLRLPLDSPDREELNELE